jgi:hypothetical protein
MRPLILSVGFVLLIATDMLAAQQSPLVGNWMLISSQVTVNNGAPTDYPGPNPRGYLLLTPEGRMMAFLASSDRKFGTSDVDQAQLLRSMLAYSGKYRVEGTDFITTVDVSSIEAWNGTEQRRHYTIDGDTLTIVTEPQPSLLEPGRSIVGKLVWEREK